MKIFRSWIRQIFGVPRKSEGSRLRSKRASARHEFRPRLEILEDRLAPAGNIAATSAFLVNSQDQVVSTPHIGDHVYVQVNFTTHNLPSNARYRVSFTVDGVTLSSGFLTYGAGGTGTQPFFEAWGYWTALPGTNNVTVTVDPDHSVSETSYADNAASFTFTPQLALTPAGYTVDQIRTAYGINNIPNFGAAPADGSGQIIAIVNAFNDPNILTDLDGFDKAMTLTTGASQTLYDQYGPASSILTVYNQSGVNITANIGSSGVGAVPSVDPTGGWENEEAMDVEWAHAIAPGAKIVLIECNGGANFAGLFTGAAAAANLPGVTVVSMSWIWSEANWSSSGGSGELAFDGSTFVTPNGHPGVTFLAATGDGGTPGGFPAFSPNVVAVGATTLNLSADTEISETGWIFPTPRTLNNGSSSYTQSGTWTTNTGGFSGAYSTAVGGGAGTATWKTSISSSDEGWVGGAEVSATWVAKPGNATNATYSIYNGSVKPANLLGTVTVDQTRAPVGTLDGSSAFQELGDFAATNGSITVVLSSGSANGTVVADAIGIAPAWASAGGQSQYETEPTYQLPVQSTGKRTTPDVSFVGDFDFGVWSYDSYNFPSEPLEEPFGGTSLAAPCWAGLIAIANQGRVAAGGVSLNSPTNPTQALQAIYSLPTADFNDITSGYNGSSAGPGYDEVTGRGSPIANLLIPDLVGYGLTLTFTSAASVVFLEQGSGILSPSTETFAVTATGAPTYSLDPGSAPLPAGVTLDSTGLLHGLPTAAAGTYPIIIDAANDAGTTAQNFTLTVLSYMAVVDAGTTPILSYVVSGNTVTVTTDGPTTFASGDTVLVAGLANAANNGAFQVQTGSSNGITFTLINNNAGISTVAGNAQGTATDARGIGSLGNGLANSQRSMVDSITYTFSQAVTLTAGAFTLAVQAGQPGTVPSFSFASPTGSSGTVWVVTFGGVTGDSIADGIYNITLNNGSAVTVASGGSTVAGTTDSFIRLYGDSNGNGLVDGAPDYNRFKNALGANNGDALYLAYFDFNAKGSIAGAPDFNNFKNRLGTGFTAFTNTI